ncbi:MAG: hypothetical protein D6722_04275 [Bacteroidetes bacterium]|nr:MAG: hypothetical protein D6722_04275 [Bacteroidota bacterium]
MLCLIFTRKYFLAATCTDQTEWLRPDGHREIAYGTTDPAETLAQYLPQCLAALSSEGPVPVCVVLPGDQMGPDGMEPGIRAALEAYTSRSLNLLIVMSLPEAFVVGLTGTEKATAETAVLEALDEAAHLCLPGGQAEMGKTFAHVGPAAGRKALQQVLLERLGQMGLNPDATMKSQLAEQMSAPASGQTYTLTRGDEDIRLQVEITLTEATFAQYYFSGREALREALDPDTLHAAGIRQLALLGPYLRQAEMRRYLRQELGLEGMLLHAGDSDVSDEFPLIVQGMVHKGKAVLAHQAELARRRRAEAEERARIAAELEVKEAREALLAEIQRTCVDPAEKEVYERAFVQRGEDLGIPQVVIQWNISEVLSRIRLRQAQEILAPVEEKPAPMVPEPEPELVLEAPAVPLPTTVNAPRRLGKSQPALMSMSDIFVVVAHLPDTEFESWRVTFHGDDSPKIVRLLPVGQIDEPGAQARFQQIYQKERTYFEEMSEVAEAKEGRYYYRPEPEGVSLKTHAARLGLGKKQKLDDFSSSDLKCILQVFKAVRDLPVSHADLNEENILVVTKRRWPLTKEMDIRMSGFTAADATEQEMLEATHRAFGRIIGEPVYAEFRKQFKF